MKKIPERLKELPLIKCIKTLYEYYDRGERYFKDYPIRYWGIPERPPSVTTIFIKGRKYQHFALPEKIAGTNRYQTIIYIIGENGKTYSLEHIFKYCDIGKKKIHGPKCLFEYFDFKMFQKVLFQ